MENTKSETVRAVDLVDGDVIMIEHDGKMERAVVGPIEWMLVIGRMIIAMSDPFRTDCVMFDFDTTYERAV